MKTIARSLLPALVLASVLLPCPGWAANAATASQSIRTRRFDAHNPAEALRWQQQTREALFALMMGGKRPERVALAPILVRREEPPGASYVIEEFSVQSLPDRRAHVWLARPKNPAGKVGAVLAINGHGGNGEEVIRGASLYWYGRAFAEMGYVVIAPDVGQHTLQHTNWSLMGERTWDALRCLDYLETLAEVDTNRLAVAGLSLGGETTMYVAALDERVKAVCSSGWFTTVANMKRGHCPCWNFPGLEEHFDFADIFACVAPRPLVLELGEKERAPGGFPVELARPAFAELRAAYQVFDAADQVRLEVHPGGHVFHGVQFWRELTNAIGVPALAAAPVTTPAIRSAELEYLEKTTRTLLAGCRVPATDGTLFHTPDGKSNYRALWTRDFAYMVENAGDLIPLEQVETSIRGLLKGVRADGAAPDRIRPDYVPVYAAGGENNPIGEPNIDNAQFLAILADEHLRRVPVHRRLPLFREWSATLDRAMDYIPRSTNGLVFNDPAKPHSPYGFTDTIGKTGELLFESLLYWTACRRLADWHQRFGNPARATEYAKRASLIETNVLRLWDEPSGAFLAATKDCRQIDIWGNAYAICLDFPLGDRRERILNFLVANYDRCVWRGQVRHLLKGEYWQRLLTPVARERYQNGAYWATASGWMMWALAQKNPALARRMWGDLIADFRAAGVCECINEGYRQLPSYVVSATNPLRVARKLGY